MSRLIQTGCLFVLASALAACGGQAQEQDSSQASQAMAAAPGAADQLASADAASTAPTAESQADAVPPAFAQCQSCHSATPGQNGIGPSLAGVFGTKAAEVPGYDFSDAMKTSGLTWDEATLDRYLTAPQTVVPGTKMTFPGLKDAAKRAATIAYLKSIQ